MAAPSKEQREAWRRKAGEGMVSSLDEYSPSEIFDLLDAVDELEAENTRLRRDALLAASLLDARNEQALATALRRAVDPAQAPRGEAIGSLGALYETFERHQDEYRKFELITSPLAPRPDLCAFLMLSALQPEVSGNDLLSAAEHDEVWLGIDCAALAAVITDDEVRDLRRCGVRMDSVHSALCLFV